MLEREAGEKHVHYHRLVRKHRPAQAAHTEGEEGAAQPQPVSAHAQMAWTSTPARAEMPEREREFEREKKKRVGQYCFFPSA